MNDAQAILAAIAALDLKLSSKMDALNVQHETLISEIHTIKADMRSLIGDGEGTPGRVGELETAQTFNRALGWVSIIAALLAIGVALAR